MTGPAPHEVLPEEPRAPGPQADPAARDRAIAACLILLLVFVPYDLYQIDRFFFYGGSPLLNMEYAWHSVISNLLVPIVALAWLIPNLWWRRRNLSVPHRYYYPSFLATVAVFYGIMFYQIHLVGTFNTIIVLFNLGLFLIVSWILRWRHALFFFWASNLVLVVQSFSEYFGWKRYAPLSARSDLLASIYLDGDVLAMNLVVYGAMAAIIAGTVTFFRRSLERVNRELADANQALASEIQDHRNTMQQKAALDTELQGALHEVKTLTGLLPICAHCKKIRDDRGYWKQLEAYLHEHSGARFTHSVCPECLTTHYAAYVNPEDPEKAP